MVPDPRDDSPTRDVLLPDGRTLAYAELGDRDGEPVFFFHGTPGSRLSGSLGSDVKDEVGARVVAPDRPGFGASDPQPGREFADWAGDVAALADELGIDEYGVVGFSGGGPYALACAAHTPERVTRCAVVSGVGPPGAERGDLGFERALAAAARVSPHLGRPFVWLMARVVERAETFTDVVGEQGSDLAGPRYGETGRVFLADFREGLSQGTRPLAAEYGLLYDDWDFDLEDVGVPTRVFHGDSDENVPLAAGDRVADEVPNADLTVCADSGHFQPIVEHVRDVYGWVVAGGEEEAGE